MRVRTKLILVFLFLAVVPLTVVSLYSYRSSLTAFRVVAEAESGALADDIGIRVESVRGELSRRIERLGSFPFGTMMSNEMTHARDASGPSLAERLVSEIGDAASMLEALEFKPAAPPAQSGPPPPHSRGTRPDHMPPPPRLPEELVIRMTPEAGGVAAKESSIVDDGRRMILRIPLPVRIPGTDELAAAARVAGAAQEALRKARESVAAGESADLDEAAAKAVEQRFRDIEAQHQRRFQYPVQTGGQTVGTVQARISSSRIFHSVLVRTRRRQGEIPFVLDAQNALVTADPADQAKLARLPLTDIAQGKASSAAPGDWIVVTRRDQNSGVMFGIARPVGNSLQEIRRTAARNLGFGLAVVALALIGIVPLSNRMTRDLNSLNSGVESLAHGDLNTRVPVRSADEFGRLAEAFNRMASELVDHEKGVVQQERLRKELEMCRRIQEELLPRRPLATGFAEAKGISIPAREVGGDFFNYFPLRDGNVGLLVGDVSGKGLPAALLMANLQATIQAKLPLESDLARLAAQLDQEIALNTPAELYLTLFVAALDVHDGTLQYVNAGHNTQFALHSEGTIERLDSTGRPLGLLPGGGYEQRSVRLRKGDALFLYTDGLTETENAAGEEFGLPRLEALLFEHRLDSVERILALVDAAARSHRGSTEALDDATMLVLKVGA